jgi:hypothetical protein
MPPGYALGRHFTLGWMPVYRINIHFFHRFQVLPERVEKLNCPLAAFSKDRR